MIKAVNASLVQLRKEPKINYAIGKALYDEGHCQVLCQSAGSFDVLIAKDEEDVEVSIEESSGALYYYRDGKKNPWDAHGIAALMQMKEELEQLNSRPDLQGYVYKREGMIKRVLKERKEKSEKEKYRIKFAGNIYGEHVLTNEKGTKYKITLRDFKNETGYIDNPDLKTNKLGTTKHIMFAFAKLKSNKRLYNKLSKTYPFIEVYLDPLNEYRITWHYTHTLNSEIAALIHKYFGKNNHVADEAVKDFLLFIRDAKKFPQIVIRPEVEDLLRFGNFHTSIVISIKQTEPRSPGIMIFRTLRKGLNHCLSAGKKVRCSKTCLKSPRLQCL